MPETVSCNLCGKGEVTSCPEKASFLGLPDGLAIVECACCGLIFMSPRPTQQEYARYYASDEVYSVEAYSRRAESRIPFYLSRLRQIEQALGRKGRLLEVGCGTGRFLKLANDAGWTVCGTEISEAFQSYAGQAFHLDVRLAPSLADARFPKESFDVVYCAHVCEHLLDPMASLLEMRRVLKQGGVLLIEVPNQFRSLRDRLRRWAIRISGARGEGKLYTRYISSVHHVFFFSPKTLGAMVQQAGFSVSKVKTYENDHRQVIGDEPTGGYWLTEGMHRTGALFGMGPVVVLWATTAA
jgi:SAM-dependent methyltransferase